MFIVTLQPNHPHLAVTFFTYVDLLVNRLYAIDKERLDTPFWQTAATLAHFCLDPLLILCQAVKYCTKF